MNYYRWGVVRTLATVGSNNHHEGRLNVNRGNQHLTRAFPIPEDKMRARYTADIDSPDRSAMVPTGWSLLAADQAGWKQLKDESITHMIDSLQVDLKDTWDQFGGPRVWRPCKPPGT